jgi:hypothetical protein
VSTSREEYRVMVFENRVLRRVFGRDTEEVTGGWRYGIMRSFIICIPKGMLFA